MYLAGSSKNFSIMRHVFWLAILLPLMSHSQFKIGNISIDSTIFYKYLADCYSRPDTVKEKSQYDFLSCINCPVPNDELRYAKLMADQFNDNLKKNNIGKIVDTIYYKMGNDTLYDGILWASWDYKKRAKKIEVKPHPAGSYLHFRGYLMPRKASEEDFIKWANKHPKSN